VNARERWLHLLLRVFPPSYRVDYGGEIVDVVLDAHGRRRFALVLESLAMARAGMAIRTRDALRSTVASQIRWGAAVTLGLLLGAGPLQRAIGQRQFGVALIDGELESLVAVVVILLAVRLTTIHRVMAAVLAFCGVGIASLSAPQGGWTISESLLYESRWLLPPLLLLTIVAPEREGPSTVKVALVTVTVLALFTDPLGIDSFGLNYGHSLQQLASHPVVIAGGVLALSAMWVIRSLPGRLLVGAGHLLMAATMQGTPGPLAVSVVMLLVVLAATVRDSTKRPPATTGARVPAIHPGVGRSSPCEELDIFAEPVRPPGRT